MSSILYKRKISKSLETMSSEKLKQAWLILKELESDKKHPAIPDKKELEKKLEKGI